MDEGIRLTTSEPRAVRGPRAGSPRGVVVATGRTLNFSLPLSLKLQNGPSLNSV
jgi:hypothetical protein